MLTVGHHHAKIPSDRRNSRETDIGLGDHMASPEAEYYEIIINRPFLLVFFYNLKYNTLKRPNLSTHTSEPPSAKTEST